MSVSQEQFDQLLANFTALQEQFSSLAAAFGKLEAADPVGAVNILWVLITAAMVFLMQLGFAMLEAGSVRAKNTQNILLKNLIDACIGTVAWYVIGHGIAFSSSADGGNGFIGNGVNEFAFHNYKDYHTWFFQWAFSASAATIVSGALAERVKFEAYLIYSFIVSGWIYPVIVHWVWSLDGWLSAFNSPPGVAANGLIDFAGSGVVHLVGGTVALTGCVILGPRLGRFNSEGKPNPGFEGHNATLVMIGAIVLWFGWYGFNPGSTLGVTGGLANVAAKVAVNTTLAPGVAALTVLIFERYVFAGKTWNLSKTVGGLLSGLVAITAGCSVVEPWAAVVIGFTCAFIYMGGYRMLLRLKIDDPVDAVPVHCFNGAWGLLMTGLFATQADLVSAYARAPDAADYGAFMGGGGLQFAMQVLGMTMIIAWSAGNAIVLFIILKYTGLFRASKEEEERGMDVVKHGAYGYLFDYNPMTDGVRAIPASSSNGTGATKELSSQPGVQVSGGVQNGAKNSDSDEVDDAVEMRAVTAGLPVKNEPQKGNSSAESSSSSSSEQKSASQSNDGSEGSSQDSSSLND